MLINFLIKKIYLSNDDKINTKILKNLFQYTYSIIF